MAVPCKANDNTCVAFAVEGGEYCTVHRVNPTSGPARDFLRHGMSECHDCNGSGYYDSTEDCDECDGSGVCDGEMECMSCGHSHPCEHDCDECDGTGQVPSEEACETCDGTGEVEDDEDEE